MKTKIDQAPLLPGVYFFKDIHHQIIYIGKAKSLKKRLKSYLQKQNDWKIKALLEDAHDIDYLITDTEIEAMLLEADLIKEHRPKYNVLLKSGQPFVYLMFSKQEIPVLKVVRNKHEAGDYFGPFLHKRQARAVATFLTETFKLKTCTKKIPNGCLDYHIGLCAGACTDQFNHHEHLVRIELAKHALQKNSTAFFKILNKQVDIYNQQLLFEKARNMQAFITNLDAIFNVLHVKYAHEKFHPDVFIATHHVKKLPEHQHVASALQAFLQTDKPIITIDCFDISHFQSRAIVGSCVRFCNGLPNKHKFRKFNIKTLKTQNDYACLQEIVNRRYKDANDIPDLVLIDGGKGQLQAITSIIPQALCASIAKKQEIFYSPVHPQGIKLDVKTIVGKTLIALRDYAHHFAISYHKHLRNKI